MTYSPADIEAANPNMPGGDIYSGSCALDQNLIWRPRPGLPGHRTHVDRLWHIGASTHPGPGPRRRLGHARGEGAAQAAALAAAVTVRQLRLVVTADGYDEAVRFYRDVLGMGELAVWSSPDGGRVLLLDAGRATLGPASAAGAAE